ncbi:MAG: WYL domain-containing protein [Clostridia bacterium]|nr:WYL domain-containing protein [Clostridia bacterium]
MRDFYVYGFKTREEYDRKSARSYDDERRRFESWMPDNMRFLRNREGKITFISIDSRQSPHNPLYKAWKSKSFTDKDITLHFILFDILHSPEISLTLNEILDKIAEYLSDFEDPLSFDESTVRKKLKEYCAEGIIIAEKQGKKMLYRRADSEIGDVPRDALDYFSEILPCGVIGSFLLDKQDEAESLFGFKHHYITGTLDSGVLESLFDAMSKKCYITLENSSRRSDRPHIHKVLPLRIFISTQSGRQHLLAYHPRLRSFTSMRVDYISGVEICEVCERFDEYRAQLSEIQKNMWGVSCRQNARGLETLEFTLEVLPAEEHIVQRLYREKRIGEVTRIDETHYRFSVSVFDSSELIPWVRTFISRVTDFKCSNRAVENCFKLDIKKMQELYGIGGDKK